MPDDLAVRLKESAKDWASAMTIPGQPGPQVAHASDALWNRLAEVARRQIEYEARGD